MKVMWVQSDISCVYRLFDYESPSCESIFLGVDDIRCRNERLSHPSLPSFWSRDLGSYLEEKSFTTENETLTVSLRLHLHDLPSSLGLPGHMHASNKV